MCRRRRDTRAGIPTKHCNLGDGLQFRTARSVAGQNRHPILHGLEEAGECVNVDRGRNF